jgi:ankyrin repeat protein
LAAVDRGHKEIVKLLLANKAGVNAKSYSGDTALHVAVRQYCWTVESCYKDVATLLLDHNAEVNAKDYEGRTPLALAMRLERLIGSQFPDKSFNERRKEIAELLRQRGGHE